ncbi:agmatinase [Marinithermofilum abyssi]|uniref:Agmatinase n=1 Tax=Marinithermofilum abyssi TaxID=1571185 RepID=A0A8J2VF63_9BACL|nr:agmatinase [Marinithermofilum abyssi]GGE17050.1 agmatinase [Marinithermofilum abyssi]
MTKYQPADSFATPRFSGVRTFMRLPYKETLDQGMDFVVTGIPFDTGGSYRVGTRFGPQAIRDASVLLRPYNVEQDLSLFDYVSGVDYGDLPVVPGYIRPSYDRMVEGLSPILEQGIIPIVLGGDHSITLGELRAVARVYGKVGLVHFDAHSDTWDSYFGEKYNHGTPFRRAMEEGLIDPARSIQVGMRGSLYGPDDLQAARDLGFAVYSTNDLLQMGTATMVERIRKRTGTGPLFLSFDIDFLDPVYAPGTGTPEVAGPSIHQALELVRGLKGLKFVGFDLVEVLPSYDHGQITALAAANIVYEFITLIACNKKAASKHTEGAST